MLKRLGAESLITSKPDDLQRAEKIILPGVGSFDQGIKNLNDYKLKDALDKAILEKRTPILGICLGMQLMGRFSQEGALTGLGWIDAEAVRFDSAKLAALKLKIPHMGWNFIKKTKDSALWKSLDDTARFYFLHSYHMVCREPQDPAAMTHHGYDFVSSVERGNIFGVQFHPEKSHKFGLALFKNFIDLS